MLSLDGKVLGELCYWFATATGVVHVCRSARIWLGPGKEDIGCDLTNEGLHSLHMLPWRIVNLCERVVAIVWPLHVEFVLHALVKGGLGLAAVLEFKFVRTLVQAHCVLCKLCCTGTFDLNCGKRSVLRETMHKSE